MDKKSILQMARGAIEERFDLEMGKAIDNILDVNTKATAKRKIVLTVEIAPDEDRTLLAVTATAKSTLAATKPIATALYLAEDVSGTMRAVESSPQIDMFGGEQEPAELKIVNL